MATTDIAYTETLPNSSTAVELDTETLVAAPTNDMRIVDAQPEKTVLVVANSSGDTDLDITIKAGDYPPALAAGLGDLVVTVPFGDTLYIGPLESGRFLQNDGSMMIEAEATSGTIGALLVSRRA
jgi:hypothetical protein